MPKYLTQEDLQEIQKRCDAALPTPWVKELGPAYYECPLCEDGEIQGTSITCEAWDAMVVCYGFDKERKPIEDFICNSRQDIPNLLHTIKVYRTAFEHLLQASSENYTQVMYLYEVIEKAQKQLQSPDEVKE